MKDTLSKLFKITFILIALSLGYLADSHAASESPPTVLLIKKLPLTVDGKTIEVFRVEQPDGTWGYHGTKGEDFNVIVKNQTNEPTSMHWHGLILPNDQDGVPFISQRLIQPGQEHAYHFKLQQAGTFWMHAHYKLQNQRYLSAPLIIHDPEDKYANAKEVIMFLSDLTYKEPSQILYDLQHPKMKMKMPAKPDLFDVKYDSFITNYRTLKDPEVVHVQPGQLIRLRVINGASGTNFFVNTGKLKGEAIAVDGNDIVPFSAKEFQIAVAQRMDFLLKIPEGEGAYPILAQGEGTDMQTGLILATPKATIPTLSEKAETTAGAFNYEQELRLKALHPLVEKKPEQTVKADLEGNMAKYIWMINNEVWPNVTPIKIKPNKRTEIVFNNLTGMAHPMHLHGHVFEVTEIDGKPIQQGAMHDTIMIQPHSTLKIQFDSDHPGNWMFHCHLLYHQAAGMETYINYDGFPLPWSLTASPPQEKGSEKSK